MALFVAAKFSPEEMPILFDPGPFQDLKVEDFIVAPRNGAPDVAFVACLEYKSIHQLKLRREPFPRVLRKASQPEVDGWRERKALERRAFAICKERARELRLDIKISHVRYDMNEAKAIFHFTSDQRVDFRALVKDLNIILKAKIELWQIGVRDEARFVDGFGVCGLQTCCSSWLTEFRPITIKMAKDQDINLPPTKLSGQCGRLLCCLSYEVDQYKQMSRGALPKGATVKWDDQEGVIVDRNLIAGTYLVGRREGGLINVKAEKLAGAEAQIPEQMKRFGKKLSAKAVEPEVKELRRAPVESEAAVASADTEEPVEDATEEVEATEGAGGEGKSRRSRRGGRRRRGKGQPQQQGAAPGGGPATPAFEPGARSEKPPASEAPSEGEEPKKSGRRKKRRRR